MAFKKLGALFLQPRSQGRYSAADFRDTPTEHMMRSLGKKLAWRRREWIVQQTPSMSFAFARGAVAAAILKTTLTGPDKRDQAVLWLA